MGVIVIADLDTLLIALYVELTDRIIPSLGFTRSGPGQRPQVTDAELVCLAVAQVLLRFDDERPAGYSDGILRITAPAGNRILGSSGAVEVTVQLPAGSRVEANAASAQFTTAAQLGDVTFDSA